MANLVKDNPKEAARRSPTTGQFKYKQPSGELKSSGIQARNARLHLQALLESNLDELLANPAMRQQDIEAIMQAFKGNSKIMDIYFNRMLRAITDTKTEPRVVSVIVDTMVKLGYGDKIDLTTNGKDLPTPILGGFSVSNYDSPKKD